MASQKRRRSRDPFGSVFDDPFFGGSNFERKVLRTQPVHIQVLPLPKNTTGVPFSGVVGHVTMTSGVDTRSLKVGDSATFNVALEGSGNLMDAAEPVIAVPDGFKVYKDNPVEDIKVGQRGFSGKKTFQMALVPVKEGTFTIPSAAVCYFDVEKGIYQVVKTQPVDMVVGPAPAGTPVAGAPPPASLSQAGPSNVVVKKKVEYIGHDILPLKESLEGAKRTVTFTAMTYTMFLLIPLVCLVILKGWMGYSQRGRSLSSLMVEKAEKSLKEAAAKNSSDEEFMTHLYRAFVSTVYSKAPFSGETLTGREVRNILTEAGCDGTCIGDAEILLEKIESFRFGGQSLKQADRDRLMNEIRSMIRRIR
jgi:hypothetical protein